MSNKKNKEDIWIQRVEIANLKFSLKVTHYIIAKINGVRGGRFELPILAEYAPQAYVYTVPPPAHIKSIANYSATLVSSTVGASSSATEVTERILLRTSLTAL